MRSIAIALILATAGAFSSEVSAPRLLLLDGVVAGDTIIVVGERGAIFRSLDNANTWRRAPSDTRATLTAVSFSPDDLNLGWAVGHDAQIIATTDRGRTWSKQYQGDNAHDSFLDVVALDRQRVLAVGAYGLFAATSDGGKTWTRRTISDGDFHFNRITAGPSGTLYIAGEHGTGLRSRDRGATWASIAPPYDGSLYGILPVDERTVVAHGLRGHVFRSIDDGGSWQRVEVGQAVLLATSTRLRTGEILLAGHAQTLLVSRDAGKTFAASRAAIAPAVAELTELPDGRVLAVGEAGAAILNRP